MIGCCADSGYDKEEINGCCLFCQELTVNGDAYEQCFYSPVECKECGFAPCDGSC